MLTDYDARKCALNPSESFIVQAPAGSGKTGLLVYRMLSLLATVQQPQEVLAITFTRKATAEMRERLLELLSHAEQGLSSNNGYQQQGIELANAVIERDRRLGWQLLDSPHQLQILTIDSFCGRLAGSMPWLSRLGDRPRTTDKAESHYAAAVEQLLAELLDTESELAADLQEVLLQLDFNYNKARSLFAAMLQQRDQWLRHVVQNDLTALRGALEHAWQTVANEQVASLSKLLPADTLENLIGLARYAHDNAPSDKPEAAQELRDMLAPLVCFERSVRLLGVAEWQALAEMLLVNTGESFRKRVTVSNGFPPKTAEKEQMMAILREFEGDGDLLRELNGALHLPPLQFSDTDWAQLESLRKILRALAGLLQLRFRAVSECDHSEVTQRANLALQELNDPTDLALRLDNELKHILVDEFQDTSHGQIELLKRLTCGWTKEQGPARTLFLVGDPMQSIYRFREADVSLFLQVADNANTQVFDNIDVQPLLLSENFRSSHTLVDWFNTTFAPSFPAHNNVLSGAIRYASATSNKSEAIPAVTGLLANDRYSEAALVVDALQKFLRTVRDDKAQVAILVRGRNHLLQLLPALRAAGIAYTGVDIQPLANQQAVIDLLALVRAICREDDRVAWLGLLRGPWCGLTLNEIKQLAPRRRVSVWQQIKLADLAMLEAASAQRLKRFTDLMTRVLAQRQQVDLSGLTRWAWQQLGGPSTLFGASEQDVATVFDLLRDMQRGGDIASMKELDTALDGLFAQPGSAVGGQPRVVVSTMHKAKGLQYHTVILPGLSRKPPAKGKDILMWAEYPNQQGQSQLLMAPFQLAEQPRSHYNYLRQLDKTRAANENMRLMYVASTRAEQHLVLIGEATYDAKTGDLKGPAKNTLLATIWAATKTQFTADAQTGEQTKEAEAAPPQTLHRLPPGYQTEQPPNVRWRSEQQLTHGPNDAEREALEYQWSSDMAAVVGTVLHRWLQFNHAQILSINVDDVIMTLWRAELLAGGLAPQRLSVALLRLKKAVHSMQADPQAKFVFGKYPEQRNEYALAANEDGAIQPYYIDRTFVADDVRWIIDYKTTYTEQPDLKAFAQEQVQQRHRPQLENYGALMRELDDRPIKLAVYFPLLGQLVSWDYQE